MSRDVDSIEFRYTFDLNGWVRHCVWRQSGERFYYAGLWIAADDTRSHPSEAAWDGRHASHRPAWGILHYSNDRAKASLGSPAPMATIWGSVELALGLRAGLNVPAYEPPSARRVDWNGHRAIELSWESKNPNHRLVSVHLEEIGYLPVFSRSWEVGTDRVISELSDVEAFVVESRGRKLYLPARYTVVSGPTAPVPNVMKVEIDRDSVRVDFVVVEDHFRIQPHPVDKVIDMDSKQTVRAPLDPKWKMDESVGFPFNVFFEGIDTSTLGQPEPARAAGAAAVGGTELWSRLPMLLIAASIALAIYAVVLMLRRRFAGS